MFRYVNACDQFHQAFPHISTASDKHWGEKAWVKDTIHEVTIGIQTLDKLYWG